MSSAMTNTATDHIGEPTVVNRIRDDATPVWDAPLTTAEAWPVR